MSIVDEAIKELESNVREAGVKVDNPTAISLMLRLKYGALEKEVFGGLMLDQKNRVLHEVVFAEGIENRCHVYLKEVVRAVLATSATGLILFHNHPSGSLEFSGADKELTGKLKDIFTALEIRVLDHIVVTSLGSICMSEEGLI